MVNENKKSEASSSLNEIRNLILQYNQKATCGIVFKINEKEYPLELIKVLNLIRDKLQRWANSNIFTYIGNLFENNKIIIIGAENQILAADLVMIVYLREILKSNQRDFETLEFDNLETSIKDNINNNMVEGYPYNDEIENAIKHHLLKILAESSK
jgi:hypothetical protein